MFEKLRILARSGIERLVVIVLCHNRLFIVIKMVQN